MDFICSLTGKSPSTTGAGSEGALTRGSFAASHSYARGGVHHAQVTVADDDGGRDAKSFAYGTMRIDVKPAINLKAQGAIPVEILGDPGFDTSRIDVTSLHFGPAGAPEAHGKLEGEGSGNVMTHYDTQASGIRPRHRPIARPKTT